MDNYTVLLIILSVLVVIVSSLLVFNIQKKLDITRAMFNTADTALRNLHFELERNDGVLEKDHLDNLKDFIKDLTDWQYNNR